MNKNYLYACLLASFSLFGCSNDEGMISSGPLSLSTKDLTFSDLGGSKLLYLSTNSSWKAVTDADWIEISPAGGTGGKDIEIRISALVHETDMDKIATITFQTLDGLEVQKVNVKRGDLKPSRELDSLSLVRFYMATGGPERWFEKWDLTEPMDNWGTEPTKTQVVLDKVDGEVRVVQVFAQKNNLRGNLPEELANLTALRYFSIEDNEVAADEFPAYFAEMENLEFLNLAQNLIKGELPAKLFDLKNLEYLVLHHNQLSGNLPSNIGNAKKLITLSLFTNNFTGTVPQSLSDLTNIKNLWLSHNKLNGEFPSIDAMKQLEWLEIAGNGEFKEEIVEYKAIGTELRKQYVRGGFSGAAPRFKDMPNLKWITLSLNNFTESPVLENCPNVEQLMFENNAIKTVDPSVFALNKLYYLRAHDNEIAELPEITGGEALRYIVMHRNKLRSLPATISKWTAIEEALFYDNALTTIPSGIENWRKLMHIQFNDNNLTALPEGFWNLTALISMRFTNNEIVAELPNDFLKYTNLMNINMCNNKITGSVAPLTTISKATELHFSNNNFTGTFPEGFEKCYSLKVLRLDNNNISGAIHNSLGSCLNLKDLTLNNNQLTGSVPRTVHMHSDWKNWNPSENILPQQNGVILNLQ